MTQINETTLPELIGSEKQIAWAEKIRARELETLSVCINAYGALVEKATGEKKEKLMAKLEEAKVMHKSLASETSASKIINGWG